jgi:hypothetical protein
MLSNTYKLIIFNLFLLGAATVGYFFGYVSPIFKNDATPISAIIALIIVADSILFIVNSIRYNVGIERWLRHIHRYIPYIGLLGTMGGLIHLILGVSGSTDPSTVILAIKSGMLTLANSTFMGIVAFLISGQNFYLSGED